MNTATTTRLAALGALLVGGIIASAQPVVTPAEAVALADRAAIQERMHLRDFSLQRLELPRADVDELVVEVNLMGAPFALDLRRISMRAPDFQVFADEGLGVLRPVTVGPARTYEGVVDLWPEAVVSASIVNGGLRAIVWFDEENVWCVQPAGEAGVQGGGLHVVYKADDTLASGHRCGNDEAGLAPPAREAAPGRPPMGGGIDQGYYKTQIAFDADVSLYALNFFNVNNTIADIESVAAGVNTIYRRDVDICLSISTVIVRTTFQSNPYTTNDAETLLSQFTNHWQANHQGVGYDIAHLMTGRELDGSTIGIAWVGAVCNSLRYGLSETAFSNNYNSRVGLTAHEIGHNFGAGHCNDAETYCGYQPSDCRIMCSSAGGCSGNVTSFNSASIACIESHRNSRTCLETCGCGQGYLVCPFPCLYRNIATPVALAECGSTITIDPDHYDEQLTIDKTLLLQKSGSPGAVIIGAP
jgi:hypothetical protein